MTALTSLLPDVTEDDDLDEIVQKACAMPLEQQENLVEWLVENIDDEFSPSQWAILDAVDGPTFVRATVGYDRLACLEISTLEELFRKHIEMIGDTLTDEWAERQASA